MPAKLFRLGGYLPDLDRARRNTVIKIQTAPIASITPNVAPSRITDNTTADSGSKHVSMDAMGGAINSILFRKQQNDTMVPHNTICK